MESFGLWWGYVPVKQKEFKELVEKAEKYDEIQASVPFLHHLTFEQFVIEYGGLKNTLEAVKEQLVEFPCIHIQDYQRMLRKIEKILGND